MKSKSFELQRNSSEKVKQNKTYDFINFYKPASESNVKLAEKRKSDEGSSKENDNTLATTQGSKRERSPNKKKKKLKNDNIINISQINLDDINVPHTSGIFNDSKVTSTPNVKGKKNKKANVKSIMKNPAPKDKSLDVSTIVTPTAKPKKRNKSVSFMLDETEEVVVKRTKSDDSANDSKDTSEQKRRNKIRKKKTQVANKDMPSSSKIDVVKSENVTKDRMQASDEANVPVTQNKDVKKKNKKQKNPKPAVNEPEVVPDQEVNSTNNNVNENKVKKLKARKRKSKTGQNGNKKELKPEVIAEDLQNLNIGDNPHTLTNLLDEMTVVDKVKKQKNKKNNKKDQPRNTESTSSDKTDTENKEKEKVKWRKRKWNKDKKAFVNDDLTTSVVIENLPLKIMCNYKKLMIDYFTKFGGIKQVGVAELYSTEDPETFTTTVSFDSEDATEKALEEDNTLFEGSRIRIKRPMPPSQTTLVVRCYATLMEPALSSVFAGAGRIRNVRRLVKGKKSMCTAFIEFDGPEAVERAIKLAEGVKIERKKIFASKYEMRNKNKKLKTENENNDASDSDE